MQSYLIVCRSLTYAQRTAGVLERVGITARVLRTPKRISAQGCSHSVKVAPRNLEGALDALRRAGLMPKQVFASSGDGEYQEVAL